MIETGVVLDKNGEVLFWHEPPGRTSGSIPDDPDLWTRIWEARDIIGGHAHTHPWAGPAYPSEEDLTTYLAIERGLGRKLQWYVVTMTEAARIVIDVVYPAQGLRTPFIGWTALPIDPPAWVNELRNKSTSKEPT